MLTTTAAIAAGVSWLVIAKVLGDTHNTATLASALLVGINWLAAVAGIAMVAAVSSKGGLAVVVAYFGGAAVRFLLNLLTVVILSVVLSFELQVIVVALAAAYLPLLLVEAALIGWHLWQLDDTAQSNTHNVDKKVDQQMTTLNITEAVA